MISPTGIYRPDLELVVVENDLSARRYVADRIFPFLSVGKKGGPISKLAGGHMAQAPSGPIKRASRSSAARIQLKSSLETYLCERYTAEADFDDDEMDDFIPAQSFEQAHAIAAEGIVRMELELDVASILFNTTNFPLTGTTGLDGVTAWATVASATPKANVHQAWQTHRDKSGGLELSAYGLLMNAVNAQYVVDSAEFAQARSTGFRPRDGTSTEQELAAFFGVGEVTIANSARNTAGLGLTASYTKAWSSTWVGLYVIPGRGNAGLHRTLGRIMQWDKQARGAPVAIDMYREEGKTTNVVRAEGYWDAVLLNSDDFFLIDVV